MIDAAIFDKPPEIVSDFDGFFECSGSSNSFYQPIQDRPGEYAGMNRGLAAGEVVSLFPGGPVDPAQNIIEQANGMIRRDRRNEPREE